MLQMDGDKTEEVIVNHKTLSDATFIAKYMILAFGQPTESFRYVVASDFAYLGLMFLLNEATEPHLPHVDELIDRNELMMEYEVFF